MPPLVLPARKILILAANPRDSSRLRLDEEVREIHDVLRRSRQRDRLEVKVSSATRPSDIQQALLDFTPQIVHFCGHGEGTQGLIFEDDMGSSQFISSQALANLFELFANQVECVVLNACYSEVQAQAIVKHIDAVIGTVQPIGDIAAIRFAEGFYRGIGDGQAVEFSYRLGCNSLELQSIPEEYIPVLMQKSAFTHRQYREDGRLEGLSSSDDENRLFPSEHQTGTTLEAETLKAEKVSGSSFLFSALGKACVLILLTASIFSIPISVRVRARPITIKVPQKDNDKYYYALLDLALKKGAPDEKFEIEKVVVDEPQINELTETDDKNIDVAWMMTNLEREYFVRPIKIPLTQGLLAYRICIVSQENKALFDDIEGLDDFNAKGHSIGQVHDWPDSNILRESGIKVETFDAKPYIFRQLEWGEIDCFARGASEIWDELEPHKNLTFDESIFFKYASPVYFFVGNENEDLERIINRGLKAALEDGDFCELLMEHYGEAIRKANLPERQPINLSNQNLPRQTPTQYYLNFELEEYPESRGECE